MLSNNSFAMGILGGLVLVLVMVEAGSLPDTHKDGHLYRLPLYKLGHSNQTDDRFEQVFRGPAAQSGGKIGRSQLSNIANVNYFTKVSVGNPAKQFVVKLTIDSCELVVLSKNFPGLDDEFSNYYDDSQSVDFESDTRRMDIKYPEFGVSGRLARDTVEIAGIRIKRQLFMQMDHIDGKYPDIPIDGILGLGVREPYMQQDPRASDIRGPFESLIKARSLASNVFSLSLNHKANSDEAGQLILGAIDTELFRGNLTWAAMTQLDAYQFRLDSIQLRNVTQAKQHHSDTTSTQEKIIVDVCRNGCTAILSTLEPMIVGAGSAVFRLNDALGASHVGDGVHKMATCSLQDLPMLVIGISGREFVLGPDRYVYKAQDGQCYSIFVGVQARQRFWVLGERFLANFYAAFDYDLRRVGLAESVHQPRD